MCIFCEILKDSHKIIHENELFFSVFDNYPVNQGHTLIIPKRHVENYFQLTDNEKIMLDDELKYMKNYLADEFHPDGFNIGINQGKAAGQTIFHLHIHLIPRYNNDVEDPRGGVRGVIPNKQKY
ncbi:MAG TPA: HIT family protein [Acholeplasmataceae bacterium]|nr:HIT family protein [Acholeplasmataceae bacterium]